jgi:hypothetical protein
MSRIALGEDRCEREVKDEGVERRDGRGKVTYSQS